MAVELVPVVEGGDLWLEHHQALLSQAESTLARGWAEGGGRGLEGPGDVEVLLLLQPLVLQGPDVLAETGCSPLVWPFEVLLVIGVSQLPLRFGHADVGLDLRPLLLLDLDCGHVHHASSLLQHPALRSEEAKKR